MSRSILVVDDDDLLRQSLAYSLTQAGYQVQTAANAEVALALIQAVAPDLVLLDVGLPGIDGLEALRRIQGQCPVIFVTARRRELDEVLGLELGAEDYITKPFNTDVLLARVRTVLRRPSAAAPPAAKPISLVVGDLVIDPGRHTVTLAERPVQLAPLEFRLLYTLAQAAGQVLSAEELLQQVWGSAYAGESQILYVYIRSLRQKLEENPQLPRRIMTVRNIGYKLFPQEPEQGCAVCATG